MLLLKVHTDEQNYNSFPFPSNLKLNFIGFVFAFVKIHRKLAVGEIVLTVICALVFSQ